MVLIAYGYFFMAMGLAFDAVLYLLIRCFSKKKSIKVKEKCKKFGLIIIIFFGVIIASSTLVGLITAGIFNSNLRLNYNIAHKNAKSHKEAVEKYVNMICDKNPIYLDVTEYWESIKELAEENNPKAQFLMGVFYEGSYFETPYKDLKRALYWYLKSADNGYGPAQYQVGIYFTDEIWDKVIDFDKAIHYFNLAVKNNVIDAYYPLAICLDANGEKLKALKMVQEGAKKGSEDCKSIIESPEFLYNDIVISNENNQTVDSATVAVDYFEAY